MAEIDYGSPLDNVVRKAMLCGMLGHADAMLRGAEPLPPEVRGAIVEADMKGLLVRGSGAYAYAGADHPVRRGPRDIDLDVLGGSGFDPAKARHASMKVLEHAAEAIGASVSEVPAQELDVRARVIKVLMGKGRVQASVATTPEWIDAVIEKPGFFGLDEADVAVLADAKQRGEIHRVNQKVDISVTYPTPDLPPRDKDGNVATADNAMKSLGVVVNDDRLQFVSKLRAVQLRGEPCNMLDLANIAAGMNNGQGFTAADADVLENEVFGRRDTNYHRRYRLERVEAVSHALFNADFVGAVRAAASVFFSKDRDSHTMAPPSAKDAERFQAELESLKEAGLIPRLPDAVEIGNMLQFVQQASKVVMGGERTLLEQRPALGADVFIPPQHDEVQQPSLSRQVKHILEKGMSQLRGQGGHDTGEERSSRGGR